MQPSPLPPSCTHNLWNILYWGICKKPLYVNLWIEEEHPVTGEGNPLGELIQLVSGRTYLFLFAIEPEPRVESRSSKPFEEPEILRQAAKTELEIEVFCPVLDEDNSRGYARRTVDYYAGYGLSPQAFRLKPTAIEPCYLTVRLLLKEETVYRDVLVVDVVPPNTHTTARTEVEVVKSAAMPRR